MRGVRDSLQYHREDKGIVDDIKLKLIESFISGMAAQMTALLESDYHTNSAIDQNYLQSAYKYVIQMMDGMFEIQSLLDEDVIKLGFNDQGKATSKCHHRRRSKKVTVLKTK
jgi:hypothetical protein